MDSIKYYIKGSPTFPNGVINRLLMLGGVDPGNFKERELANPINLFYIDFYNDNIIRKVTDDEITGQLILENWKELQPITYIDKPESLPDSWEKAYDNCIEVKNYIKGNNPELDQKLDYYGRVIVLRDIYRQGWTQKNDEFCYYITYNLKDEDFEIIRGIKTSKPVSFQEIELAQLFLENFKEILEVCKDII